MFKLMFNDTTLTLPDTIETSNDIDDLVSPPYYIDDMTDEIHISRDDDDEPCASYQYE